MPDGGQVSLDWTPSSTQKPLDNTPTLVVLHGLTGGSHESYIRGLLEVVCCSLDGSVIVYSCRGNMV